MKTTTNYAVKIRLAAVLTSILIVPLALAIGVALKKDLIEKKSCQNISETPKELVLEQTLMN